MTDSESYSARTLRADARRNLERIRIAAREAFAETGLDVPMDEVARRAGVGVGTVYRRFPDKEALLHDLCLDALTRIPALARTALAEETDTWQAFSRFMREAVEQGAGALLPAIAGQVPTTDELLAARVEHDAALTELVSAAQEAGQLREDIGAGDIPLLFTCVTRPVVHATPEVASILRRRYLAVVLDGLRAGDSRSPLPGRPLTQQDVDRTYFKDGANKEIAAPSSPVPKGTNTFPSHPGVR